MAHKGGVCSVSWVRYCVLRLACAAERNLTSPVIDYRDRMSRLVRCWVRALLPVRALCPLARLCCQWRRVEMAMADIVVAFSQAPPALRALCRACVRRVVSSQAAATTASEYGGMAPHSQLTVVLSWMMHSTGTTRTRASGASRRRLSRTTTRTATGFVTSRGPPASACPRAQLRPPPRQDAVARLRPIVARLLTKRAVQDKSVIVWTEDQQGSWKKAKTLKFDVKVSWLHSLCLISMVGVVPLSRCGA